MKASNIVATVDFSAQMGALADKADNQALTSTAAVLLLIRDNGGTNKKSASALWALLPDTVVTTFAQAKRINGALNAPTEKATDGAKAVRALWIDAKNQTSLVKGLLDIGVQSPRALLDLVAPRKDPKAPVVKTAVEIFLNAASVEGFSEDLTPLLVWLAEGASLPAMLEMAKRATAEKEGKAKDAAEALAAAKAAAEKFASEKAAKAAKVEAAKAALIAAGLYTDGILAVV